MLRLALDAVFAFSVAPIRLATRVGVGIAALGALYLVYTIGRALWLHDTEPGWSSLLSSLLILGGLQLAFTGLIGEYLARVFEQVKGRPIYVFKQPPEERPRRATPAAAKKNARTEAPLELANEQG
ncbi:hypothetical protein WME90_10430 [Sorangium sp. So ce375]|uniref:hypothetical protein n=1 Tax=Sorangium sp. So ce375 TaxID=3133306 RepID=UPI003F5BBDBA